MYQQRKLTHTATFHSNELYGGVAMSWRCS